MIRIKEFCRFKKLLLQSKLSPYHQRLTSEFLSQSKRINIRHLFTNPTSSKITFDNIKILQQLHFKDGIPFNKYTLIYRCNFSNYLIAAQLINLLMLFTLTLSIYTKALEIYGMEDVSEEKQAEIIEEKKRKLDLMNAPSLENVPVEDSWRNGFGAVRKFYEFDFMAERYKAATMASIKEGKLPNPTFDDVLEGGIETYLLMVSVMVVLLIATIKVQQQLPVRIYTSQSGHSVGIFYGHAIPTKTTKHEFVSGLLKSMYNPKGILWSHSMYKDGGGRKMILFDHMFRVPADFHRLIGIKTQNYDEEEEGKDKHGQI